MHRRWLSSFNNTHIVWNRTAAIAVHHLKYQTQNRHFINQKALIFLAGASHVERNERQKGKMAETTKCGHFNFMTNAKIARLEDSGGFMADIMINCIDCKKQFKFLGMPLGLNMNGVAVSPDLGEARLAIAPMSEAEMERFEVMKGIQEKQQIAIN